MSIIPLILLVYFVHDVEKADDSNMGMTRANSLYFRGLLSLVVVFHHIARHLYFSGELVFSDVLFEQFGKVGYLAVSVFFFFSGYGLMTNLYQKQEQYLNSFLSKRCSTVVLPYLIVALMTWVVEATLNHKIIGVYDFLKYLVVDKVIVKNGWYVVELIFIYIGFWVIASYFDNVRSVKILLLCYNVALAMMTIILGYESCWYTSLLSFNVGTLLANEKKERYFFISRKQQVIIFLAIVFFFILGHKVSIPIGCFAVCNISGGLFCILLFEFWRKYTFRKASVMYKLGAFSYETYLIHGLIMLAIRSNTLYIHSKWAFCLITVFFTLLLAYLFHMFLNIMFRKNGKKVR